MFILCKDVSEDSPSIVYWESKEVYGVRHKVTRKCIKVRDFDNFDSANNFAAGLQKKGIRVLRVEIC